MRRPCCGSYFNNHAKALACIDDEDREKTRHTGKLGYQPMVFQCCAETKDK